MTLMKLPREGFLKHPTVLEAVLFTLSPTLTIGIKQNRVVRYTCAWAGSHRHSNCWLMPLRFPLRSRMIHRDCHVDNNI